MHEVFLSCFLRVIGFMRARAVASRFRISPLVFVCLMLDAAGVCSGSAAETVWLSSLDVSKTVQSAGRAHVDKSYVGKPLTIAGRKFDRGLGTHAISTLAIDLKGGQNVLLLSWVSTTIRSSIPGPSNSASSATAARCGGAA